MLYRLIVIESSKQANAASIQHLCVSQKIRKADLPWWPCETFSGVLSHACTVRSTSIDLSPTSQITEYYGILQNITVDYGGLRLQWITVDYVGLRHNLELRNNYSVNYKLHYDRTKNP
jgi:hypothetical protein